MIYRYIMVPEASYTVKKRAYLVLHFIRFINCLEFLWSDEVQIHLFVMFLVVVGPTERPYLPLVSQYATVAEPTGSLLDLVPQD